MLKTWFSKLLTPKKEEANLWQEMLNTLYDFYASDVNPNIKRVKNRVSLSTMSDEDIDIKISELGKFFVIRKGGRAARAMLLRQRLDEIHFKGTDRPIDATFWRELKSLPATWEPLYAPSDLERYPYGSLFLQEIGIDGAKPIYGDFFLTSRGSISISLNDLRKGYGDDTEVALRQLIEDVDLIIRPLIPAHIVFDGFRFVIKYTFTEKPCTLKLNRIEIENRGSYVIKDHADHLVFKSSSQAGGFTIKNNIRSISELFIGLDDVVMDGWEIGLRATPAIIPRGQVIDDRIFVRDEYLVLKNDGYVACMIQYDNGYLDKFEFPYFATEVVLPVKETRLPLIQKIIYLDTAPKKLISNFDVREHDTYLMLIKTDSGIGIGGFQIYDKSDKMKATLDSSIAAFLTGKDSPFTFPLTIDDLPIDSWALGLDFTDEE